MPMYTRNEARPRIRDTFAHRGAKKTGYSSAVNVVMDYAQRTKVDFDTLCRKVKNKEMF